MEDEVRLNVKINRATREKLKKAARKKHITVSALMRMLIYKVIDTIDEE